MFLICCDVLVLLRFGFPQKAIMKIWLRIIAPSEFRSCIAPCLHLVFQSCPKLSPDHFLSALKVAFTQERLEKYLARFSAEPGAPSPSTARSDNMGYGGGKGSWGGNGGGGAGGSWGSQSSWGWPSGGAGGGKGNFRPPAGGGGGSGGQFGSLAGNMERMLGEISAISQMTRLGAILSNESAAVASPAPQAGGSDGATSQLAQALQKVLGDSGQAPQDTRLAQTVQKLADLAGLPSKDSQDSVESSPAFKRLRDQVCSISGDLEEQKKETKKIQGTVLQTHSDIQDIKKILVLTSGGAAAAGSPSPSKRNRSGSPGTPDLPVKEGENGREEDDAEVLDPLFSQMVSFDDHTRACSFLGIGQQRQDMVDLKKKFEDEGDLPYGQWWATVCKTKAIAQWRFKIERKGFKNKEVIEKITIEEVGLLLFCRLTSGGLIAGSQLQEGYAT